MISKLSRFMLSDFSRLAPVLTLIALATTSGSCFAQSRCSATLTDAIGTKTVRAIVNRIEQAERTFQPAANVVAAELAYTASETLPLLRRADLLNPVRPKPRIFVDAYYGADYKLSSSDVYFLPADWRTLCILQPGRAVFLSDNATHHYAIVDAIDYQRQIVTLLDPWSRTSFLLEGYNFADVKAKSRVGPRGQPLLDVSFADFLRVLHGSIEEFQPQMTFAGLEAYYPEIANTEDYLFWKHSRLLMTDSFQMSLIPVIDLASIAKKSHMPKLQLLSQWANDYFVGVISGFTIPEPGRAALAADIPRLRSEFMQRLPEYAKVLPWNARWLLIQRAQRTDEPDLTLTIVENFLRAAPTDIDLQILRAEELLRRNMAGEARGQLETASAQWKVDVAASIAKDSPEEAIAFLLAKDYGLQSLAVLHWRHLRIELLQRIAQLQQNTPSLPDHDAALEAMQKDYVIGSVLIDFFPQVMWSASLSHSFEAEGDYVKTVASLPDDDERLEFLSGALYEHFTTRQPISEISEDARGALRYSSLGRAFCNRNWILRAQSEALKSALVAYCWPTVKAAEGRWTADPTGACSTKFFEIVIKDGVIEVKDQRGSVHEEQVTDQSEHGFDTWADQRASAGEKHYRFLDPRRIEVHTSANGKLVRLSRC